MLVAHAIVHPFLLATQYANSLGTWGSKRSTKSARCGVLEWLKKERENEKRERERERLARILTSVEEVMV